nr:winged helix-turn-helix transcriptional regulator [Nocardia sp. XZ_19_231]
MNAATHNNAVVTSPLRKLVDHGVIVREQYRQRPVRYQYRLTDAGRALAPVPHRTEPHRLIQNADKGIQGASNCPQRQ